MRNETYCRRRQGSNSRARAQGFSALWLLGLLALTTSCIQGDEAKDALGERPNTFAVPNDNRASGGRLEDGRFELDLEARAVLWRGEKSDLDEAASDPTVLPVLAFSEPGADASIPGPMIRVPQGTEVVVRVRNSIPSSTGIGLPGAALRGPEVRSQAGDELLVHGLRAGTHEEDVLRIPRGEVREVRYRATEPGTFFYWGTPSERTIEAWTGIDAQLAGAIIVDPPGVEPDPDERIFVITMVDQLPDPEAELPSGDYFRRAINGRSWPDTERLEYELGDIVRWRWINASFEFHPMHLHGFHYLVTARGDWQGEQGLPEEEQPLVVTERMAPGSTYRMEWQPHRAGNWVMHCHFIDHIVPAIERSEEERSHDHHDVEQHALDAMAGLVLGITVTGDLEPTAEPSDRFRLFALEKQTGDRLRRGFVVAGFGESEPTPSDLTSPSPALILTRGETTEIEVVNRLSEATTIHWHGLELESVYDGVAGWSRTGSRVAPLIEPGGSFAVRIRPPRAGTFIYHTHMDETEQLYQGMVGPFLVLEPEESFDRRRDRVFLISGTSDSPDYPATINGSTEPQPERVALGEEMNIRIVHLSQGLDATVELMQDGQTLTWRAHAKDGADLPPALRIEGPSTLETQTGETFDFRWTPSLRGEARLVVRHPRFLTVETVEVVQRLIIE